MGALMPLFGRRFGKLTVSRYLGTVDGHAQWRCACDCGSERAALAFHLLRGDTTHCGCGKPKASVRELFRQGLDTVAIAEELGITEAEAYNRLFACWDRAQPGETILRMLDRVDARQGSMFEAAE